jgi:hypothetical protein
MTEEFFNDKIIKEAFDYTPGPIVDCSVNGMPGYKANYDNCKCYVYEAGDENSQGEARRKATVQDYHKQRRRRITGSAKEATGFFTTDKKDPSTLLKPDTGVGPDLGGVFSRTTSSKVRCRTLSSCASAAPKIRDAPAAGRVTGAEKVTAVRPEGAAPAVPM